MKIEHQNFKCNDIYNLSKKKEGRIRCKCNKICRTCMMKMKKNVD